MPTPTDPTCRCLTGSTAGRGPCEACGAIAELHLAEENDRKLVALLAELPPEHQARPVPAGLRAVCLPCAERPDLARAA